MNTENFNKEMENMRKYEIEMKELKNTIIALKNTLEWFSFRLDKTEERINELMDGTVELTQSEQQKE